MTETTDPFYLFVLRHPETGEYGVDVAKLPMFNQPWQHQRYDLSEIYRLEKDAWAEWQRAYKAREECDLRTNQGLEKDRLEKIEKQLSAYARELQKRIIELEAQGLIKKPAG